MTSGRDGRRRSPIEGWWRDDPPAPAPLRLLLRPASALYGVGRSLHRALWSSRVRARRRLPVPVASVGNVTVGGVGKTPFTGWLARELAARGVRVLVLGRGYGRSDGARLNDEGEWLERQQLAGVRVVQSPDRGRAALAALAESPADLVLLDDGFQHEPLARDLDVVLVDARDPFGNGRLLPAGPLREPAAALARAHFVFATRAELVAPDELARLRASLAALAPAARFGVVRFEVGPARRGPAREPVDLRGRAVVLLTGVARPDAVRASVESLGARVAGELAFPDHHEYARADLADAERRAGELGAELVVTAKDAVKLDRLGGAERRLVLEQRVVVPEGGDELLARLLALGGQLPLREVIR